MLYYYKALTKSGEQREGSVDAPNQDTAIGAIQGKGLIVVAIKGSETKSIFEKDISFINRISLKDVVVLSRQIATLFEAHISALRTFRLLAVEAENPNLRKKLNQISDDIQTGIPISQALSKHPTVFSDFYVSMVHTGEESGKLSETFLYLADYLDRYYELTAKTKHALIYPAFVIGTFIVVMILMMTVIVPKLGEIIRTSGQAIPVYTQIVLSISDILVHYGLFVLLVVVIMGLAMWYYTKKGAISFSKLKLSVPVLGDLYRKLYLSRIADNLYTMLSSGIPILRAVEVTGTVVGNKVYENILKNAYEMIRGGSALSDALGQSDEIPHIMIQMVKVGEETGKIPDLMQKLAFFYKREVDGAVDSLVALIEPVMIVILGLGVGTILAAVLLPIYNIAGNI
ncbi:MAG: type II secretion system F family protein [Minisyncoccota bacterium]